MNQLRGTLVLALIVAGLAYATYLASKGGPGGTELTESALAGRSLLEAERIEIRSQRDVQPIELQRSAGYAFEVVEPVRDLASAAMVRTIAGAWDSGHLARACEPEDVTDELLRQYGLDNPRGELRVVYPDEVIHIEIGDDGAMGHDVYVRRDGVIYFASKALFTVLQGTSDDFREPSLFLNTAAMVRKLTVVRRKAAGELSRLVVRQIEPGRYQLEEPIIARAHSADTELFVASVVGLQVGIFERGNMMPQPEPDWEIEVEGQAGVERLRLWRQPNTMLLGVQEPRKLAFMLEDREYSRLFDVPAERMRSRLLIPKASTEIAHVKLDPGPGGRAAVLRRGPSGLLELERPVRKPTDPTASAKLLRGLGSLGVEAFVPGEPTDLAPFGLAEGYFTVEVKGAVDPRPITVHLGLVEGDLCYARRADEGNVVQVKAAAAADLRQPWEHFVERKVYRYPAINVVELRLTRGAETRTYRKDGDVWSGPAGGAGSEHVESAVETLTYLDARAVLDPQTAGDLGPSVTVQVMGLGGAVFVQMSVFERDGRSYVTLPGVAVVYELREADAAVIGRLAPN